MTTINNPTAIERLKQIGDSAVSPTILATLITPLHLRPFRPLPMLFPPVFLFSTYLNLAGFKKDAAGLSAAWAGMYFILASRRKNVENLSLVRRVQGRFFSARGVLRGAAMVGCAVEVVAGGVSYVYGKRDV